MSIKVWAHGDKPTAAQINEYKTVLDAANSALATGGGAPMQIAAEHMSEAVFGLMHCYRYLHFGSVGQLVDPAGVQKPTSLSEGETGLGVLDLDSLGWLAYGMRYEVTGVTWCQEDWDA